MGEQDMKRLPTLADETPRQDWTPEEIVQKIKIRMTRAEVKDILGSPHDCNIGSRKYWRPMVWKYGEVELTFEYPEEGGLVWVSLKDADLIPQTLLR